MRPAVVTPPLPPQGRTHSCARPTLLLASTLFLALLGHPRASVAQMTQGDLDMPDGPVYAVAVAGDTLYLGGAFTRVGPVSQYGAVLSNSGRLVHALMFDGRTFASAPDGAGGWFIGGEFGVVNGLVRDRLVHVLADGTIAPWAPQVGARVLSLAVSGSTVYVAGEFNDVNGESRNHVAAIDAVTGQLTSWNPNAGNVTTSYISAVAVSAGTVYMAGLFPEIGSTPRPNLAAIDSATGTPTSWNPQPDREVLTLAIRGTTIYAGGRFTVIGGQARQNLAALDASTGLATAFDPGPDSEIEAITPTDAAVYVGGFFTSAGGQPRSGVAALDPASGAATDWAPILSGANIDVRAVLVEGSAVYLGGSFDSIGGVPRHNLGEVDAVTGQVLAWDPGADQRAFTLAMQDSLLFAGGELRSVGGRIRHNLAAIDRTTRHVTDWDPDANDAVRALAWNGATLFAGGSFDHMGGLERNHLAALDPDLGAPEAWDPGADGAVRALALRGSTLYVGGAFKHLGGQPRSRIAALDVATALPTAWDPGADSTVRTFAIGDSMLYVGGTFQQLAGQPRSCMGAVDYVSGAATAWRADVVGTHPDVYALVASGPVVYAGGDFFEVSGQPRAHLAALDAASGALTAFGPSFDYTAYAIAQGAAPVDSGILYVAGANLIRAYDGAGHPTGWAPYFSGNGYALATSGNTVYLGGDFTWIGDFARQGIAAIEADHTTPTLLQRFDAEPTADGIVLHWQLLDPLADPSQLERADSPDGPWTPLAIPILRNGDRFSAVDQAVEPGHVYAYRIVTEVAGRLVAFAPIVVRAALPPEPLGLTGITPNPTSGVTTIDYVAPRTDRVQIVVLDAQGRIVERLVNGVESPGVHQVVWSAGRHGKLYAGVYFVRYTTAGRSFSRRVVLAP